MDILCWYSGPNAGLVGRLSTLTFEEMRGDPHEENSLLRLAGWSVDGPVGVGDLFTSVETTQGTGADVSLRIVEMRSYGKDVTGVEPGVSVDLFLRGAGYDAVVSGAILRGEHVE